MKVSLFIPCLVEHFRPEIGEAAAVVLARAGAELDFPADQTCCGQPAFKTGRRREARRLARRFIEIFEDAEAIVTPSGSCAAMVRKYYPGLFETEPDWQKRAEALGGRVFELTEFLVDVAGATDLGASLEAKAVYHDSCQVGRALGVKEQPLKLLERVKGLEMVELDHPETCCGFGGLFSLQFPDISEAITADKAADIAASGAEYVISAEVSCLMNIGGFLAKRPSRIEAVHIAEVLAGLEKGR